MCFQKEKNKRVRACSLFATPRARRAEKQNRVCPSTFIKLFPATHDGFGFQYWHKLPCLCPAADATAAKRRLGSKTMLVQTMTPCWLHKDLLIYILSDALLCFCVCAHAPAGACEYKGFLMFSYLMLTSNFKIFCDTFLYVMGLYKALSFVSLPQFHFHTFYSIIECQLLSPHRPQIKG